MPREQSGPLSWFFAECVCGEITPTAIIQKDGGFICANCHAREKGEPERVCLNCRKSAPFEVHHTRGWKVSPLRAVLRNGDARCLQ
jgi:hypothetical protein